MLHMQNPYLPASGTSGGNFDWSGEIGGQGQTRPGEAAQQNRQVTNIQVNQHNTNQAPAQAPSAPPSQTTPPSQDAPSTQITLPSQPVQSPSGVPQQSAAQENGFSAGGQQMSQGSIPTLRPQGTAAVLDLRHNLSDDVIQSPTTVDEAHMGSMKAVLNRNLGNYVVATFLVGTQGTTAWEGMLFEVGNDYLIIYQTGRDRYVVCDIYSLKYIEFYDTRRQEMCDNLMRNQGWQNNGWQQTN